MQDSKFILNILSSIPVINSSLTSVQITMTAHDFSTPPYPVDGEAHIKRHQIEIPSSEIERLHLLLDNSHIPDKNWENSHQDGHFGTNRDWLVHAVKEWRHNYDWYVITMHINSY
jgi:hypothetical protein